MLNTKKLLIGSAFAGVFAVAGASSAWAAPANTAFTDDNFYKCVVDRYNITNSTSVPVTTNLTDEQLATIKSINCENNSIVSTAGIEKLTGLTSLVITGNSITSINLTKNTALTSIDLSNNALVSLDLSANTALTKLDAINNKLTSVNLTKNSQLTDVNLYKNLLPSIDISNNTNLQYLTLSSNQLTSLNVSNNKKLVALAVYDNKLAELDLTALINYGESTSSIGNLTADDITVKTALIATYADGKYTAALGNFVNTIGLRGGYSTIDNTDSYTYTKTGCIYDYGCIIINDVSKYPGYIQTKATSAAEAGDPAIGESTKYYAYKIVITPYREEETDNSDSNTSNDAATNSGTIVNKNSGVGTPDTGVFGGMANGALIAIPATIVAIVAAVWFTVRYGAKRISGRVKFNKWNK